MAYLFPFRSWLSLSLRVFAQRTTWSLSTETKQVLSCTYLPPQRVIPSFVIESLPPGRLPSTRFNSSSSPASLQHSRIKEPLFFTSPLVKRPRVVAFLLEVPPSGFGYPLEGFSSLEPWKSFSTSHALGISPSELFSGL